MIPSGVSCQVAVGYVTGINSTTLGSELGRQSARPQDSKGNKPTHVNPKKLGRINKGFEKRYNNTLKRDSDKIALWALWQRKKDSIHKQEKKQDIKQ